MTTTRAYVIWHSGRGDFIQTSGASGGYTVTPDLKKATAFLNGDLAMDFIVRFLRDSNKGGKTRYQARVIECHAGEMKLLPLGAFIDQFGEVGGVYVTDIAGKEDIVRAYVIRHRERGDFIQTDLPSGGYTVTPDLRKATLFTDATHAMEFISHLLCMGDGTPSPYEIRAVEITNEGTTMFPAGCFIDAFGEAQGVYATGGPVLPPPKVEVFKPAFKPLDVEQMFTYHAPTEAQVVQYTALREAALTFAKTILANTPAGAYQTLAIRDLQTTVAWANAAIALEEKR